MIKPSNKFRVQDKRKNTGVLILLIDHRNATPRSPSCLLPCVHLSLLLVCGVWGRRPQPPQACFASEVAPLELEKVLLGEVRHFPKSLRISAFHKESESGVFGVEIRRDNFLFSKTKV